MKCNDKYQQEMTSSDLGENIIKPFPEEFVDLL